MIKAKKPLIMLICAILLYANVAFPASAEDIFDMDYDKETVSDWAKDEVELAYQAGVITEHTSRDFTDSITRFQFAELIASLTEKVTGQEITPAASDTFVDCTEAAVLKAYSAGIIYGVGNSRFDPDATTNREQIATMIARAIQYIEAETGKEYTPFEANVDRFSDRELISSWAIYGVGLLAANNIMNGISSTEAGPKNPCTIEQSVLLVYRFYADTKETETALLNENIENKPSNEREKYLVVFKDWDGITLKAEYVHSGEDAIPPINPTREGYTFIGWDVDFHNVSLDTIVTAKYQKSGSQQFAVTFYDYDGTTILATRTGIPSGGYATPPSAPTKVDAIFIGWDGNYIDVIADTDVKAVYSDDANVFSTSNAHGKVGETVKVLLSIDGKVRTCGFDITIVFDEGLELVSYDEALDLDIIVNDSAFSNGIKLNYSGTNNTSKQRDIIEMTFRIKDTKKLALPIWLSVTSIYEIANNNPVAADFTVIDSAVIVDK